MFKSNKTSSVKSVCRRCGKEALAEEFVLDPVYKMVVCPGCIKERKTASVASVKNTSASTSPKSVFATKTEKQSTPQDWDEDDEYLERMEAKKQTAAASAPKVQATRIDDENVKITCPKCNYGFKYNTYRHHPASCPYCGKPIKQAK